MVRSMSYSSQPSHSATSSIASSTASSSVFFLPQYMKVPEPEYISIAGAISTVENYLPPENVVAKDVTITPTGLRTVNLFLDYILHEILARTQSTALFRLREGVALVLRTTLGTSAMANGEQELMDHLYIGETEGDKSDDENDSEVIWDLERVWARTRIICMVYSILGDKEQDDFEEEEERKKMLLHSNCLLPLQFISLLSSKPSQIIAFVSLPEQHSIESAVLHGNLKSKRRI